MAKHKSDEIRCPGTSVITKVLVNPSILAILLSVSTTLQITEEKLINLIILCTDEYGLYLKLLLTGASTSSWNDGNAFSKMHCQGLFVCNNKYSLPFSLVMRKWVSTDNCFSRSKPKVDE